MEIEKKEEEKKLVTAEEFTDLLVNEKYPVGYQLIENLILDNSIIQNETNQLTFNNCHFNILELHNIGDQIRLMFNNCTVSTLFIDRFSKDENLNSNGFRLFAQSNTEIKRIALSKLLSMEISFSDSTIGELEATSCSFTKFICDNAIFKNELIVKDSKLGLVKFEKCIFERYITFYGSAIKDKLTLSECHFKDQFLFALKEKTTELSQLEIKIESCKADDSFTIRGKNSIIEKLFLSKHSGHFVASDLNITKTEIQASNKKDSSYIITNCSVNVFECFGLNSELRLSSVKSFKSDSKFLIGSSNMRDSSLFDVNLKSFDKVIFNMSDLTNLATSSVTWFDDEKLEISLKSDRSSPQMRREFYRQLKHNQEKQSNKIQALVFQSLEMRYYSKELRPRWLIFLKSQWSTVSNYIVNWIPKFELIRTISKMIRNWSKLFQNRIILWVGKSNGHGQNFLKPIVILIVLSFPFYWLILRTVYANIDFAFLQEHLNVWAQLLNPIHDVSKIFIGSNLYSPTHLLDLAWKIIEAILIFQTITAFRKYIRV